MMREPHASTLQLILDMLVWRRLVEFMKCQHVPNNKFSTDFGRSQLRCHDRNFEAENKKHQFPRVSGMIFQVSSFEGRWWSKHPQWFRQQATVLGWEDGVDPLKRTWTCWSKSTIFSVDFGKRWSNWWDFLDKVKLLNQSFAEPCFRVRSEMSLGQWTSWWPITGTARTTCCSKCLNARGISWPHTMLAASSSETSEFRVWS